MTDTKPAAMPRAFPHVMIDIETLGTRPRSVILSIGAVAFDAEKGTIGQTLHVQIDPADAQRRGLTIDAATALWWMDQSKEAQRAAFSGTVNLTPALRELTAFLEYHNPSRIWAKPPTFDITLLEAAYRTVGLPVPWNHRAPRDCRTLFEIANVEPIPFGTAHNALDDAISQTLTVISAYTQLDLSQSGKSEDALQPA